MKSLFIFIENYLFIYLYNLPTGLQSVIITIIKNKRHNKLKKLFNLRTVIIKFK